MPMDCLVRLPASPPSKPTDKFPQLTFAFVKVTVAVLPFAPPPGLSAR